MEKTRPNATPAFSYGVDGRDCYEYISYKCPKCNKSIEEKDIACAECGIFFDWSKTASIETIKTVVWR